MHTYIYPLNHIFSKTLLDVHISNKFRVNRSKSCSLPLSSSYSKGAEKYICKDIGLQNFISAQMKIFREYIGLPANMINFMMGAAARQGTFLIKAKKKRRAGNFWGGGTSRLLFYNQNLGVHILCLSYHHIFSAHDITSVTRIKLYHISLETNCTK